MSSMELRALEKFLENQKERSDIILNAEEKKYVKSLLRPDFVYLESSHVAAQEVQRFCPAAQGKFMYISPYGEIQPCPFVNLNFGNIRFKNLNTVLEDMAKNFKQAVELKPDFLEAVFNLALTYHEMGDFANAERHYRAALLIKPSLLRTHLKLAQLYTETNRKEMAIDEYRKAFQYDPAFFYFKQTLGKEFQYINIYNKFKAELDEKVKTNPNNPTTNITLAKLYKAQGYKGKASNLLRKVLAATPNNREAKKLLSQMNKKS